MCAAKELKRSELDAAGYPWLGIDQGATQFDASETSALKGLAWDTSALVFYGDWCGDTREQLPVFLKLADAMEMDSERLRYFSLDRDKKLEPWTSQFAITHVPTFVFLRDGKEIGRVVEAPSEAGWSGELRAILSRGARSLQEKYAAHSICFGCGPANEKGLHIRSFPISDSETIAEWKPEPHHEAFPGMLNGGIIGALLDCHSNWTAAWHLMRKSGVDQPPCTVTADYAIKLLRPTPTREPVRLSARVVESKDDRANVEASLVAGGKVCATCRGTFVAVKPGHPAFHRW
jgi:acyl-coenzyme A thioesterase PaaI-like protein/thiol-disulfide isomerase/thioredoxin